MTAGYELENADCTWLSSSKVILRSRLHVSDKNIVQHPILAVYPRQALWQRLPVFSARVKRRAYERPHQ
jgi:hypothetical protein